MILRTLCVQCFTLNETRRPLGPYAEIGFSVRRYWQGIPVIGCSLDPHHWHFPTEEERLALLKGAKDA